MLNLVLFSYMLETTRTRLLGPLQSVVKFVKDYGRTSQFDQ